ncbi:hypothetical protein HZP54_17010 [Elizabethkingia anophelis]|nr:hypothetical protein [Elizabethkingia anophelis]
MKISNETGLIASLLGSQVAKSIPRFAAVQNEISKHVLPPVRFLPLNVQDLGINEPEYDDQYELWKGTLPTASENQFFPLSFRAVDEKDFYLFPWEPIISIESENIIAKRNVAKAGQSLIGSVKERWTTGDYRITITGAFYGDKMLGKPAQTYPRKDMERLRHYLLSANAIEVRSEALQILDINRIVIESVTFPFTKGENVQAYEIRALSDFPYQLIYKRKASRKSTVSMGDWSQEKIKD